MSYSGDYKLDVFDTYNFIIIAPVAILTSAVLIFAQLTNRHLLKQPGDLVFMVSISELFLSVYYFISGIRTSYIYMTFREDSTICRVNSWIYNIFVTLEYLYNICLMCHIYFTLRSAIQKSFVPKTLYHFLCIGLTAAINAYYWYFDKLGKTPYGMCGTKVGVVTLGRTSNILQDLWVSIVAILFGVGLGFFVLLYTSKTLPNFGRELNDLKRDFMNYYKSYIQACIMIWIIIFFSSMAQVFGEDQHMMVQEKQSWLGNIFDLGRIGNTAKVVMPLLLFFIRIQDPLIRKNIWTPFSSVRKRLTSLGNMDMSSLRSSVASTDSSKRMTSLGEPLNFTPANDGTDVVGDTDDLMWMNLLPAKIKESYTRTFLACIYFNYEKVLDQKRNTELKTKQDTQDIVSHQITGSKLMKALKTDKSIVDCMFTIYSPAVFREVIQSSFKKIDLRGSTDIFKNEEKIKKAGESGGGASGELFMFSHDGQLILKTATHEEVEIFKDILLDYKEHFRLNKASQISKIFGLFDFSFPGNDKSIKLILMENLFTLNSECIMRKYDMKGSKHARKVMKGYKDLGPKVDKIMKDLDFLEIDKSIDLEPRIREEVLHMIDLDVSFFRSKLIIDYSIILAVIDKKLVSPELLEKETANNPHFLQSVTDPDKAYLLGIIDYFQLYDYKKAMERFFKRVSNCNPRLDTSSQPPKRYSERFLKFVQHILH
jgi:1-phosphatidylinositol-4-phosphate 5-kinase